ncbi:hypothetical protein VPHD484_0392 [Vibrio phage D484]
MNLVRLINCVNLSSFFAEVKHFFQISFIESRVCVAVSRLDEIHSTGKQSEVNKYFQLFYD